jgi:hypothetical protein
MALSACRIVLVEAGGAGALALSSAGITACVTVLADCTIPVETVLTSAGSVREGHFAVLACRDWLELVPVQA